MNMVIQFGDVSYSYGQAKVLEDIEFSVKDEEFFGLIGPNAGGKSTLLKLMLGVLVPPLKSNVSVFDSPHLQQ